MSSSRGACHILGSAPSVACCQASDCSIDQQLDRAVTEIPIAVRFWRRLNAMMAQGQELLRTFRQLLATKIFHRTTLRFVAAGMRRRIDAVLSHAEVVVRTICHPLGNLSPRKKTLALVVAGVVGLAL